MGSQILKGLTPFVSRVVRNKKDREQERGENTTRGCDSFKGVGWSFFKKIDPSKVAT